MPRIAPAHAVAPVVPPETAPPAAPGLAPAPPPAPVVLVRVRVRLSGGELVEVAAHEDELGARREATALMRYLRDGRGDWPFIGGAFIRPETIVSISVQSD
jgi:hypothetical protein